MAKIPPLSANKNIVDGNGRPTPEFMLLLNQLYNKTISDADGKAQQALDKVEFLEDVEIIAGTDLDGGGVLGGGDITIDHTDSGAAAGTYGSATKVPVVTVNARGHVTEIEEVDVSGGGGGGTRPTVRGNQIAWFNNTSSINLPLPTGSAVGDFAIVAAAHGWDINLTAGWTNLDNSVGVNWNGRAFYKTLDATDISNGYVVVSAVNSYYGVAGITVFVGGTISGLGTIVSGRAGSSTGTRILNLPGSSATDVIFTFGAARGNGTVSFAPSTASVDTANLNGSGVVGYYDTPGGPVSETITFASDPSGNYGISVQVLGTAGAIVSPYKPPSTTAFSIDIGSAKTVDSSAGGVMLVATTNSSGLQARLMSASAPCTLVLGFRGNTQANFNGIGLVVRDSAGKYVFLADLAEGTLEMSNWSNAATFSSSPFSAAWVSTPQYFRAEVDASNDIQWSVSENRDGPWYDLGSLNTYLGTVDAIGFAVNRNNASSAPVAWFFDYEKS